MIIPRVEPSFLTSSTTVVPSNSSPGKQAQIYSGLINAIYSNEVVVTLIHHVILEEVWS
jgi:hypothetical protein